MKRIVIKNFPPFEGGKLITSIFIKMNQHRLQLKK